MWAIALTLALLAAANQALGDSSVDHMLDAMPEGYHLYAYDDCGVDGRQPHVRMDDCYMWTFNISDTDAGLKERSAVFSYKHIDIVYDDLDPKRSYILAMTYASDHVYNRVQSLTADGTELHGPLALPKAKAIRQIVRVPGEVTRDGKMSLRISIHGEVNATVSIVELWATGRPPAMIHMSSISALNTSLVGQVLGLDYEALPGAEVRLSRPRDSNPLAVTKSGADGSFSFDRKTFAAKPMRDVVVTAAYEGGEVSVTLPPEKQGFEPVRYRPVPVETAGLKANKMSLDGKWRIHPDPPRGVAKQPLDGPGWGEFSVPGQWVQQGYDVSQDKTAAVAREFTVPKEWSGQRVFLRFDSIHAGTTYRLNGRKLGYSENLFTPVEWEITGSARPGAKSRLDLEMKVDTVSEKLSFSSGYAFHSLGGIDRSVWLYALPATHIRSMHLSTDLDADYRDAKLNLKVALDRPSTHRGELQLAVSLLASGGDQAAAESAPVEDEAEIVLSVRNPLKWTAETPNLYRLIIELKDTDRVLERVERSVGFRKIEIRERQLYVNGVRVKLAGVCRHELDPLTGRANTMHLCESDLTMLKAANLNYVRTSHYPPPQELLDAADRLGMYVEVEAPFCWVAATDQLEHVREVLTPTSAMVDYCHTHPSVVVWSIANESHFSPVFAASNDLVKSLDPTRPTTFNHPMSNEKASEVCDIANLHYSPMPYDALLPEDRRPLFMGEYFFPICHEQTDVMINPGLRELWGHGHALPDSDWGKMCAESFKMPTLHPGTPPGMWNHVTASDRVIGGAIWAANDEPFYLPNGKRVGYAWVHGFWGLIDAWRRPKPEYWLCKLIFSPVWFAQRRVEFAEGQESIRVPVENRYSFTDLKSLGLEWEIGKRKGRVKAALAPRSKGSVDIPIPEGTKSGDQVVLRVTDKSGELVNVLAIKLGESKPEPLPVPAAGVPDIREDGKLVTVTGDGFSFVLDREQGELARSDGSAPAQFPKVHLTRFDFGDLNGPNSPPYAELPDAGTRKVQGVDVKQLPEGLEITVRDSYQDFAGSMTWLIDRAGRTSLSSDYTYSGEETNIREIGMKLLLKPGCEELRWRRWSEWDIFPEDSISRTEGTARARRDPKLGNGAEGTRPTWPWYLDQTELGTNDFRSVKFNVYEASLAAPDGSGVRVSANANADVRACLSKDGVRMHVLSQCRLGQIVLKKGDRVSGRFVVGLLGPK